MSNKDFKFHIPVELVKGENEEDQWRVRGIASTSDQDLQGEIVDQDGLDISVLKAGRGLFNYDHQKGPENIIGQIEDAEFRIEDGKKVLWVDGYLFKEQPRAQAFKNILKSLKKGSASRVHMSIEGKILERDDRTGSKINKARIDKVALTLDPVNPYTFAELCKSLNAPVSESQTDVSTEEEMVEIAAKDLEVLINTVKKALAAGAGATKAPTARVGGEAMTKEILESKPKMMNSNEKKKKNSKEMVKSFIERLKAAHPEQNEWELAEMAIEAFIENEKGE